ncbi:MAG: DEAD/DEAH box helicase [Bacteroidales bacterium]|nr:DEAD/DEAH box helicase [Bacteroidales bacterium]
MTFEETGLSEEILKAIGELGFVTPTPVQERSIPEILNNGQDVISLAQTGTGKTGAFGLPIVQLADLATEKTQALVLSPTRELCLQISKDLTSFAKYRKGVEIVSVYGGTDIRAQLKALKGAAHIVVGTPGRVIDLIKRGALKIGEIRWLVLDEADEMLNMGFQEDIETILAETPEERQTLLFSATMPPFIEKVARQYMKEHIEIRIGRTNQGADTVEHHYYMVKAADRYAALKRIVDMVPNIYSIVFCRTRQETKEVADKLIADGYNADALHGDLSQAQRDTVMEHFRIKHLQILVATDVAARGIDVTDLTHVINYNLPDDPEVYIHRSGRTGRAGKKGISVTIVHSRELSRIKQIEKVSGKKFERKMVPTAEEICQTKLIHFVDEIEKQEFDEQSAVAPFIPAMLEKLSKFSTEELIKKVIASEFNAVNQYYQNAGDLNLYDDRKEKKGRSDSDAEQFDRIFINIGKLDSIRPGDLMGLINNYTRDISEKISIGHIDIMRNFSFIDVDKTYSQEVINRMNGQKIDGYKLVVEMAGPREGGEERKDKGGFGGKKRRDRGDRGGERRDRDRRDRRDRGDRGDRGDRRDRGDRNSYRGGDNAERGQKRDQGFRARQKEKKERKRNK